MTQVAIENKTVNVTTERPVVQVEKETPTTNVTLSTAIAGPQGGDGPPGMAFGEFEINSEGYLVMNFVGDLDEDSFSINQEGKLEVAY